MKTEYRLTVQFSSVAQSCLTLCDSMNCSTPGLPVHHQLPESTQNLVIESVMPSNHLILSCPLLLLPSIFPSIRVFSNESALRIRWPKYWSFSFNISPSNEHLGLISFRMDWLDLLAVQGTLKSLLQHHSSKASNSSALSFLHSLTLTSIQDNVYSWVGKIPWRRAWQPTPVFLPGEFHGQRSLAGGSPWGCKQSDTTEQLSVRLCVHTRTHTHTHAHTHAHTHRWLGQKNLFKQRTKWFRQRKDFLIWMDSQ